MPLAVKIIISVLLVIIPVAINRILIARLKKYNMGIGYLKSICTKRLLVPLWMCKDVGPSKWSAVYRYTYKNIACTYTTPPKSKRENKPKPKSKLQIFINPNAPNEAYDTNSYPEMNTSNKTIYITTGILLMINIVVIILLIF